MATGRNTEAIDKITPKTPGSLRVIIGGGANAGNDETRSLASIDDWDYITKEMFESNPQGVTKTPINKVGSDIDGDGNIDVSTNVDSSYDLIGVYVDMLPVFSPVFFDPTALTVGPFDTSISAGTPILLRFI